MIKIFLIIIYLQIFSFSPSVAQMWNFAETGIPNSDSSYILSSLQADGRIILGLGRIRGQTYYIPGGILISSDKGVNWEYKCINHPVQGPLPVTTLIKKDSILFAGTAGLGIYKTMDWGNSWINCNSGLIGNALLVKTFNIVNDKIYVGTQNGIFVSDNNGENWQEINNGLPFNEVGHYTVNDIIYMNDSLYVGVFGNNTGDGGIYKSSINNIEWKPLLTKINISGSYYNCDVVLLTLIDNRLYMSTNGLGLFISKDNGNNWIHSELNALFETIVKAGNYMLATGGDIYLSKDKGESWQDIRFNLVNENYFYFNFGEIVDDIIFVGTTCIGLWKIGIESITAVDISNSIPNDYILYQNYPNPFNPITTINYQILRSSRITIKIYDCLGQEIEFLVDEFKEQGIHTVNFDASNLASGIYFYQLRTKDFISTKKMVVMQ